MPAARTAKRDSHPRPAGEEIHGAISASILMESFAKRPIVPVIAQSTASASAAVSKGTPSSTSASSHSPIATSNLPPAAVSAAAAAASIAAAVSASAAAGYPSTSFSTPNKRKASSSQQHQQQYHHHQQHQQPHSATATPLPTQPPALPQITDIKQTLHRRRSSYPPAAAPATGAAANNAAFVFGGTPIGRSVSQLESFPGFGTEYTVPDHGAGLAWTPGTGWEGLLDLGTDALLPPNTNHNTLAKAMAMAGNLAVQQPGITRLRSTGKEPAPPYAPTAPSPDVPAQGLSSLNRIAQFGSDLVWRTILGSRVDVEEVGDVGVARVLQEVWKRGGGDAVSPHSRSATWARADSGQVTSQGQWATILIALSFCADGSSPSTRIPSPSSHAASALQSLYTLTLRHWEPAIFSGLLASFVQTTATPATEAPHGLLSASHTHSLPALDLSHGMQHPMLQQQQQHQHQHQSTNIYGAATPKGELDLSQWMNVTPGADWSMLGGMGGAMPHASGSSSGLTPSKQQSLTSNGFANAGRGPSALAYEINETTERERRSSRVLDPEDQIRGIDELLAEIERGQEASERARVEEEESKTAHAMRDPRPGQKAKTPASGAGPAGATTLSTFQLPTPETDGSSDSPGQFKPRRKSVLNNNGRTDSASQVSAIVSSGQPTPPSSAGSPFNQAASSSSSNGGAVVVKSNNAAASRGNAPTQVTMPTQAFVPPPPMCMFFSPAFHDLQKDKVGVWKGDLELRGRGGGKFAVLIVGEQKTGNFWQSQLWPENISYPAEEQPNLSCTATMIPVAHLAREGFTPVAMGMVLCNDDNLSAFVSMVQGLHAEGVAFHLPGSTRLPIVFLPAKFDSKDPLQRLGVAFMSKPGLPLPPAPVGPPAPPMASLAAADTLEAAAAASAAHAAVGAGAEQTSPEDGPRRKRRRQSAPAKTHAAAAAALAAATSTSTVAPSPPSAAGGTKNGGRSRKGTITDSSSAKRIEENVIVEEDDGSAD